MSLRMIEGASREQYYESAGKEDVFPYEQIIKSGEEGPMLVPFFTSLYNTTTGTFTREDRNQAVDGSVTPVRFALPVPSGQIWTMANFQFIIVDNQTIDAAGWGNNGGANLTKGMKVGLTIDGKDIDFTPIPWKNHTDLARIGGVFDHHPWGSGDEFITLYIRLANYVHTRVRLIGDRGDTFWMEVNDDLTYLTEQACMANGIIESTYFD